MEDILREEGILLTPLRIAGMRVIGMIPYSVSLRGLLIKIYTAVVSYNLYRMWKMNLI